MSFNIKNFFRIDSNLGGEHGIFAYYSDENEPIASEGYFTAETGINGGDTIIHTVLELDPVDGHCTGKTESIYYALTDSQGKITISPLIDTATEYLFNASSILKTVEVLDPIQDNQTNIDLEDLKSMDIDGRPNYKEAGALVVDSSGSIGIIDSIDEENEIAVVTTIVSLCGDAGLKSITGFDAGKTQVLKNVSGVLTWVDE